MWTVLRVSGQTGLTGRKSWGFSKTWEERQGECDNCHAQFDCIENHVVPQSMSIRVLAWKTYPGYDTIPGAGVLG